MAEILPFIPLGIIGSMTWSLWAVRRFYGATYKPFQGAFTATTSVVVPVYMEDPEVLLQAIESYLENKLSEHQADSDEGPGKETRPGSRNKGGYWRDSHSLRQRHFLGSEPTRGDSEAFRRPGDCRRLCAAERGEPERVDDMEDRELASRHKIH